MCKFKKGDILEYVDCKRIHSRSFMDFVKNGGKYMEYRMSFNRSIVCSYEHYNNWHSRCLVLAEYFKEGELKKYKKLLEDV